MYVILGATGNTGKVVAETLLDGGQKVRVVGRSKERLEGFTVLGAEIFEANLADSAALTKAFHGARAVYALVPPNLASADYRAEQDATTNSIAKALEAAGVTHVVALSSFGADKADKTGPVAGLHVMEERFSQIPKLNALFLRAGYFMENLLAQVRNHQELWNDGWAGQRGSRAADDRHSRHCARRQPTRWPNSISRGHQTRELLGQRDLTYSQMAKIIGAAIGIPNLELRSAALPNR